MENENKEYQKQSVMACGLWDNDGQFGPYMSGNMGMMKVIIVPNRNKKDDKSPDRWLKFVTKAPRQQAVNQVVVDNNVANIAPAPQITNEQEIIDS